MEWLDSLPDSFRWDGACLVHDSPFDRFFPRARFIPGIASECQEFAYHSKGISLKTSDAEFAKLTAWMETEHVTQLYCAHTHIPFSRRIDDKLICNTGSAGLPLDGDTRASWVLVEPV